MSSRRSGSSLGSSRSRRDSLRSPVHQSRSAAMQSVYRPGPEDLDAPRVGPIGGRILAGRDGRGEAVPRHEGRGFRLGTHGRSAATLGMVGAGDVAEDVVVEWTRGRRKRVGRTTEAAIAGVRRRTGVEGSRLGRDEERTDSGRDGSRRRGMQIGRDRVDQP